MTVSIQVKGRRGMLRRAMAKLRPALAEAIQAAVKDAARSPVFTFYRPTAWSPAFILVDKPLTQRETAILSMAWLDLARARHPQNGDKFTLRGEKLVSVRRGK